jgi:hypothetical protein
VNDSSQGVRQLPTLRLPTALSSGCVFERRHVSQWRLGLRPGKCGSGARPPMAASARVFRRPAHHRLGRRVFRTVVAKQRLRGSGRLRRIFRTHAAGCPHRATGRHGTAAHPLSRPPKSRCNLFGRFLQSGSWDLGVGDCLLHSSAACWCVSKGGESCGQRRAGTRRVSGPGLPARPGSNPGRTRETPDPAPLHGPVSDSRRSRPWARTSV